MNTAAAIENTTAVTATEIAAATKNTAAVTTTEIAAATKNTAEEDDSDTDTIDDALNSVQINLFNKGKRLREILCSKAMMHSCEVRFVGFIIIKR